jgi:hypothetical protein
MLTRARRVGATAWTSIDPFPRALHSGGAPCSVSPRVRVRAHTLLPFIVRLPVPHSAAPPASICSLVVALACGTGLAEEELLLSSAHESSMGRSLSYSGGSAKDAPSQRNRLLLEASHANLDVFRDERVKYTQGSEHVRSRCRCTSVARYTVCY